MLYHRENKYSLAISVYNNVESCVIWRIFYIIKLREKYPITVTCRRKAINKCRYSKKITKHGKEHINEGQFTTGYDGYRVLCQKNVMSP